ncbi:Tubulin epsilon and delta complex protein 1 [Bulinus truncatus]|nr:Tubulin epsilon and delta complex protein 1 [Bulinus truncatus]
MGDKLLYIANISTDRKNLVYQTASMWNLLYDVISFCISQNATDRAKKSPNIDKEDKVVFIKSELQKWGYLSSSFAALPADMSIGSRDLLMALGWLIHKQEVFDKMLSCRSNPLHQHLRDFAKFDEATLYSQELRCLTKKIRLYTQGVSLQPDLNHLTPLEVFLLRHPESLKQMLNELESDNIELQNLLDWKDQEHVFWDWMQSALNLHVQENSAKEKRSFTPSAGDVYLPLPSSIGKDIANVRSDLRDFILRHESEIERLDQLILEKKVTPVELQVMTMQAEAEIAQLGHRLHHCGRGWDLGQDRVEEPSANRCESSFAAPDVNLFDSFLKKPMSKFIPHSEKGIKAAKLESLQQEVKRETTLLVQHIKELEVQLKQVYLHNMRMLHSSIESDNNIICIQPRCLKKLLDN